VWSIEGIRDGDFVTPTELYFGDESEEAEKAGRNASDGRPCEPSLNRTAATVCSNRAADGCTYWRATIARRITARRNANRRECGRNGHDEENG
jgi:hypothetical protein